MSNFETVLIARTTGANTAGSKEREVNGQNAFSIEVDPASAEGSWTGAVDVQHKVNGAWHDLYLDGSKVTLTATHTSRRIVGPMTVRVTKEVTSIAVGVTLRLSVPS